MQVMYSKKSINKHYHHLTDPYHNLIWHHISSVHCLSQRDQDSNWWEAKTSFITDTSSCS